MASTYEEIMAKSKELYASGDIEGARRLAKIALGRKTASVAKNPDGTYGSPPPGMVLNPESGQMTSRELMAPHIQPGAASAFATGAGQGATLGLTDEAAGGINALIPGAGTMGQRYDYGREYSRAMLDAAGRDHPVAQIAGNVVGGATLAAALPSPQTTGGLWGQALSSGKAAAAYGAASGFGTGEGGLANRAQSAGVGGVVGGVIGAATPVMAQLAQKAWRAGADVVGRYRTGAQVGKSLGIDPRSGRVLTDLVGMEDPAAMQAALAKAGPNAMLADAGPTLSGSLDAAIQSPGQASRIALGRINDRAGTSLTNINAALDSTMGTPLGVETARGAVRTGTASARAAAYDAAYAQPIDYSGAGTALEALQGRLPGDAVAYANKLMQLRGEKSPQIMASIAQDGSVTFKTLPDVRQWDYIKQALDHMAESGDGAGALGGQTRMGAAYKSLARDVRDALAGAVPEYSTALSTAADAITRSQGIKFGATVLKPGTTREEVRAALKGATKPEIDAIRQGVRSQIDDIIANVRAVPSDPNIDARGAQAAMANMTSKAAQTKLEMLLGTDFPVVQKQLDEAAAALGLRANVATNSKTAARTAFGELIANSVRPGPLRTGRPLEAAKGAAATMMGASKTAIDRLSADAKAQVADVLTRGNPAQIAALLTSVGQKNATTPETGSALAMLLRNALMGSGANPDLQAKVRGLLPTR